MAFGLPLPNAETTQLLHALGLTRRDVSPAGLVALERLASERDDLAEKLAMAEALADRDTLTPTHNRRAFLRELHRTMSEVERYKTPAAVLYVDLDGFKALNDSYGHAAGDGWTLTLNAGHAIAASGADYIQLSADSAGKITFSNGNDITFDGVEKLHWG